MSQHEKRIWTCQNPVCMKQSNSKAQYRVCSACKRASYCSPECQSVHWKVHKPFCKKNRNQIALAASKSDPETDRKIVYARPGIVQEKLGEDLRKWTKRHQDWLGGCYFQVCHLRTNPHFWRTHGVIVQLNVSNTRQSVYKFTFKDAIDAPFTKMQKMADIKGQGDEFRAAFKQAKPSVGPDGEAMFTAMTFIVCNGVMSCVPILSALASVDVMHEYSDWRERLSILLKAPSGMTDAVGRALGEWWSKQRSAIVFCCANLLDMKPDGPVHRENIYFDIMYSEKTSPDSSASTTSAITTTTTTTTTPTSTPSFIFSPLPPIREPLNNLNTHTQKVRPQIDLVAQLSGFLDIRIGDATGQHGTTVISSAGILNIAPAVGPYFITDDELADIEIRDDWEHHFYSLLVDYDLKY